MSRSSWFSLLAMLFTGAVVVMGAVILEPRRTWIVDASEQEADAELYSESGYLVPDDHAPVETPSSATSTVSPLLHTPPLDYLRRVAGDPVVGKGEIAIRVPVLMYHHLRAPAPWMKPKDRLYSVSPKVFEAQMQGLADAGYHTITPADLDRALREGSSVLPSKPVMITFDDGLRSHYDVAFPVLKRLGLKATFFIITGQVKLNGNMTIDMLKEMDKSGLMTIASHTRHHPFLAKLGASQRHDEIVGAKQDLEQWLGHPVEAFAFPYGSWSPQTAKEVEQAGYQLGFGVRLGSLHTSSSRFQLRRIRVQEGEDVAALADAFSGN